MGPNTLVIRIKIKQQTSQRRYRKKENAEVFLSKRREKREAPNCSAWCLPYRNPPWCLFFLYFFYFQKFNKVFLLLPLAQQMLLINIWNLSHLRVAFFLKKKWGVMFSMYVSGKNCIGTCKDCTVTVLRTCVCIYIYQYMCRYTKI